MSDQPGFLSRLFVSGALAFVLIGVLGGIYGVALPAFSRIYDLEPGAASLILTTQASGGVSAVLLATLGVRGLGSRTAMVLMAVGAGLIALTPGWPLTLFGSLIAGAGFGLIATHVNRSFLAGFGTRGPGMVGLVNGISGLGLIAGPILFVVAGGNVALVFMGIALFALSLVALFAPEPKMAVTPGAASSILHWRLGILVLNLVSVCLEIALVGLGATALIALGWTETAAAMLSSAFFAVYLVSRLSLFWLARLFAADRLFLIGTIGTAACAALAAAGWEATGFVIAGGFVGLAFPAFFVWGTSLLGPDPRISSAILLSGLSGSAMGPLAFGAVLSVVGIQHLFAAVAVTGALLAIAIILTLGPMRRAMTRVPGDHREALA